MRSTRPRVATIFISCLALASAALGVTAAPALSVPRAASCSPSFTDVPSSSPFCTAIRYLTQNKIIAGFTDHTFRPIAPVRRQEVAALVYRAAHDGASAPPCAEEPFPDVPVSSPFCGAIAWFSTQHLTAGYLDGNFHPAAGTARLNLTSFLYKYIHGATNQPNACVALAFPDVPVTNQFCPFVASLKVRGVVAGHADGTFHPAETVNRQEMAQVLYRILATPLANITGVVTDVDGAPLVGATVYAVPVNAGDPTVVGGTTDATGRFDDQAVNGGTSRLGLLYFLCIDTSTSTSTTPDQCAGGAGWNGVPVTASVGSGATSYPALQGDTNDVPGITLVADPR